MLIKKHLDEISIIDTIPHCGMSMGAMPHFRRGISQAHWGNLWGRPLMQVFSYYNIVQAGKHK
jgi:hypothetical protein